MEDDEIGPDEAMVFEPSGGGDRIGVLGGDGLWSVAEVLRAAGAPVVDLEPAPKTVAADVAARWHYGRASVRAGLLGHPRAALQLFTPPAEGWVWARDGLCIDGFRPEVDPEGLPEADLRAYRMAHLAAVARLPHEVDRLILPLCTLRGFVDGTSRVFGGPHDGLSEVCFDAKHLQDDLHALHEALCAVNPALTLQITLQPSLVAQPDPVAVEVALRALADVAGVIHDPVFDALLARIAKGGSGARALAHLAQGGDLDSFGGPVALASVAMESEDDKRQRRKERRKARGKDKPSGASVICEDELLEAFAK